MISIINYYIPDREFNICSIVEKTQMEKYHIIHRSYRNPDYITIQVMTEVQGYNMQTTLALLSN